MLAVDGVPGGILESGVDRVPTLDEVDVDLLDGAAGDQAVAGVARGGHEVVLVGPGHQRNHLVRGAGGLDVHLTSAVGLELGHPVIGRIG